MVMALGGQADVRSMSPPMLSLYLNVLLIENLTR